MDMRTRRHRPVTTARVCTALVLAAVAAGHAEAQTGSAGDGAPIQGRFVQVDKESDVASIEEGIERVAQAMNPMLRPVMRPVLRSVTVYCPLPVFELEEQGLRYSCGSTHLFTASLDGSPFSWDALQGDATYTVSQALVTDDELVQTFANELGDRTQTFQLQPDGVTIISRVTYESEYLPVPFSFELRFRRVGDQPATSPSRTPGR